MLHEERSPNAKMRLNASFAESLFYFVVQLFVWALLLLFYSCESSYLNKNIICRHKIGVAFMLSRLGLTHVKVLNCKTRY